MTISNDLSILTKVFQALADIAAGVIAVGFVAYGIRYGMGKAKNAQVKENTDLMENMNARMDAQDLLISKLKDDMHELQIQNVALKTSNEALEKLNNTYLSLFQGMNPNSMQTFMGDVRAFMAEWHTYVSSMAHVPTINIQK